MKIDEVRGQLVETGRRGQWVKLGDAHIHVYLAALMSPRILCMHNVMCRFKKIKCRQVMQFDKPLVQKVSLSPSVGYSLTCIKRWLCCRRTL